MPEEEVDATGVVDEVVVESTEPGWVNPTDDSTIVAESESTSPTYKVKVGGEEIEVSLDEALQGYQRQEDYTRKTQELAAQRGELDYASRLAMALEADPVSAIEALRQAYEVGATPAAPVIDPTLDPEEARFATLEQRIVAQEQAAFERQVSAQLVGLHSQFGAFDDVELVKFAVEHNIGSLEDAAKVMTFDKTFTKINADKAATAAKATAPPVAGGHGVATGAVATGAQTEKPTIREALEAAVAAHS